MGVVLGWGEYEIVHNKWKSLCEYVSAQWEIHRERERRRESRERGFKGD